MDCFYCTKDERLTNLMLPLCEMRWSDIYLFRDQKHPGRIVVALKEHRNEIFELTEEERNGFFFEVSLAAQAVAKAMQADKINYAIYGDLVSHFHVHIVPKKRDELQWGGPFTDNIEKVYLSDTEYADLKVKILNELQALI